MKTNKTKVLFVVFIMMFSLIGYGFARPATYSIDQKPSVEAKTSVSIIFHDFINPEDRQDFLHQIGAEIRYEFSTFAGVSVDIPISAVYDLIDNPIIRTWDYNRHMQILEDGIDWGVDRVDAERVWGGAENAVDVTTGVSGSGVKVAVIDTGIDYNHEDLSAVYAGGYDFYNNDNDPMDDHGHGTHVSGTIAAVDNDITGSLVGVAPNVEIYALKVCSASGSCPSDAIAAALDWSANNGMDVASLSLGGGYSSTTDAAGQNAYAAGVLLVAASGNSGSSSVSYPAANEEFIAVGATNQNDNLASFSQYGSAQELVAPGVDIRSANPNNQYAVWSGTSMATPHVSGVAALVKSADSTLTNVEIRNILTSTAEDLGSSGWDSTFGYGIVDAEAAVAATDGGGGGDTTPPAQVTGLTATAVSSSQIDLTWNSNSESDLSHYNVYRDGSYIGQTGSTSFSDTGLQPGTTYTYQVSAVDTSSNEGALSAPASATTDTGSTSSMYVSSINFEEVFEGWWIFGNYYTYVTITVLDGTGQPLDGVDITITVTWPDGSSGSGTKTTDSSGQVIFKYQSNPCGVYTVNVDNLVKSGYFWDTSQGLTSESWANC